MKYTFILDGIKGSVTVEKTTWDKPIEGWILWHTIGCWMSSLDNCQLKRSALEAIRVQTELPPAPEERNYVL